MTAILETEYDRIVEERSIKRIVEARGKCKSYKFPRLSVVDHIISGPEDDAEAIAFVDIKGRKETAGQVRKYGGLMLKHRKIAELIALSEALKIPAFFVWPFESGLGDIYWARPESLVHKEPMDPPPRRKYRGLECDNEPVVYLEWDEEVHLLLAKGK